MRPYAHTEMLLNIPRPSSQLAIPFVYCVWSEVIAVVLKTMRTERA